jgi:hypothetical protein
MDAERISRIGGDNLYGNRQTSSSGQPDLPVFIALPPGAAKPV